jgi:Synaptobrevin.
LIERGEKLGVLEDKTEAMNANARSYASAAQALADKYQRKKWYQW